MNKSNGGVGMSFNKIDVRKLQFNPFDMFSSEWPLLTAGNSDNGYNTMTIAWGHMGSIWGDKGMGAPTVLVYVRPQRYTKDFMDNNNLFTISVLPSEHKKALAYLGANSGRDEDKVAKVGLTPVFDHETTYFAESKLVFICRKLYNYPMSENDFVDKNVMERIYPTKDFHTAYIGEIVDVLVNETFADSYAVL